MKKKDGTVQQTDQDASVSRLSAVEVGYLVDPFANLFVSSSPQGQPRRFPIINRGKSLFIFSLYKYMCVLFFFFPGEEENSEP